MRTTLALIVMLAACGSRPAPVTPEPPLSEQELCERVAERVLDRYIVAAQAQFAKEYPELPPLEPKLEGDSRKMMVTVMFDSCFAQWPAPVRACYLSQPPSSPIDGCGLDQELEAGAIRRAATMLRSIATL